MATIAPGNVSSAKGVVRFEDKRLFELRVALALLKILGVARLRAGFQSLFRDLISHVTKGKRQVRLLPSFQQQ